MTRPTQRLKIMLSDDGWDREMNLLLNSGTYRMSVHGLNRNEVWITTHPIEIEVLPTGGVDEASQISVSLTDGQQLLLIANEARDTAEAAQNDAQKGAAAAIEAAEKAETAMEAATYDDTELTGRVSTVEDKVTTLIGSDVSKSARVIASEEVAKIVAGAGASYDTLKEIADWISNHTTDAAAMNSAILALQAIVEGIGGESEQPTVVAYVDAAIAALNIGDYATAAQLTALAGRVTTLEGTSHSHSNKTVLDGIDAQKVSAWDAKVDESDLSAIATSGNVNDLTQTEGDYIILNCGSASEVI